MIIKFKDEAYDVLVITAMKDLSHDMKVACERANEIIGLGIEVYCMQTKAMVDTKLLMMSLICEEQRERQGERIKRGLYGSKRRKVTTTYRNNLQRFIDFVRNEIPDEMMEQSFKALEDYVNVEKEKAMKEGRPVEPNLATGKYVTGTDGKFHVKFDFINGK